MQEMEKKKKEAWFAWKLFEAANNIDMRITWLAVKVIP